MNQSNTQRPRIKWNKLQNPCIWPIGLNTMAVREKHHTKKEYPGGCNCDQGGDTRQTEKYREIGKPTNHQCHRQNCPMPLTPLEGINKLPNRMNWSREKRVKAKISA